MALGLIVDVPIERPCIVNNYACHNEVKVQPWF